MIRIRTQGPTVLLALIALAMLAAAGAAIGEEHEDENPGFLAAKGRITYGRYCANCHGLEGKGNGSIAKFLKIPPTDLTRIEVEEDGEFPYERLHDVVDGRAEVRGHGSREMPIWGDVFQSPLSEAYAAGDESGEDRAKRMIRELVYYLETIQVQGGEEESAGR